MRAGLRVVPAIRAGARSAAPEAVIAEQAIALAFNGTSPVVLMATPTDLDDLVLGFALSEQLVASPGDLRVVATEARALGVVVEALVPDAAMTRLESLRRGAFGSSACGLCGTEQLEVAMRPPHGPAPVPTPWPEPDALEQVLADFVAAQALHADSGGAHAAAWVDAGGLLLREDVGRHNAFDKMIGARARAARTGPGYALVSSRASYELVHKAACAGIGMLIAMSAPTTAAIDLARQQHIRLAGFARGCTMTRYTDDATHPSGTTA